MQPSTDFLNILAREEEFAYQSGVKLKAVCAITKNALCIPVRPLYERGSCPVDAVVEMDLWQKYLDLCKQPTRIVYIDRRLMLVLQKTRERLAKQHGLGQADVEKAIRLGHFSFQSDNSRAYFQTSAKLSTGVRFTTKEEFKLPMTKKFTKKVKDVLRLQLSSMVMDNYRFVQSSQWDLVTQYFREEFSIKRAALQAKEADCFVPEQKFPIRYFCTFGHFAIRDEYFKEVVVAATDKAEYLYGLPIKFCHPLKGYQFYLVGGMHKKQSHSLSYFDTDTKQLNRVLRHQLLEGLTYPACCTYFDEAKCEAVSILLGGVYCGDWRLSKQIVRLVFGESGIKVEVVGRLQTGRMNHTASIHDGCVIVYGGYELTQQMLDSKSNVQISDLGHVEQIDFYSLQTFELVKSLPFRNFPDKLKPNLSCVGKVFRINEEDILVFYGCNYYSLKVMVKYNLTRGTSARFHKFRFSQLILEKDEKLAYRPDKFARLPVRFLEDKEGYCTANQTEWVLYQSGAVNLLKLEFCSAGLTVHKLNTPR